MDNMNNIKNKIRLKQISILANIQEIVKIERRISKAQEEIEQLKCEIRREKVKHFIAQIKASYVLIVIKLKEIKLNVVLILMKIRGD